MYSFAILIICNQVSVNLYDKGKYNIINPRNSYKLLTFQNNC